MNHFVTVVLLLSVGIRCLVAEPCARLYVQGLHATNYPQLAGVYVLQTALPAELQKWSEDFPVYRHELSELFLYYNSSEGALMIDPYQSHGLLKVEKNSGVEISSDVDYSVDHLFNFLSWKQWDPLRNEFVEAVTSSVIKPICVDQNVGFCTSGILRPNVSHVVSYAVNVDEVADRTLDIRKICFKLQLGTFYNIRPVYQLMSDTEMIPYYLYHKNGKWRVGPDVSSESTSSGIILEMESDAMRVEYEHQPEWYTVGSDGRRRTAFHYLQCYHESVAGANCQTAATDVCDNGGNCHIDSAGGSLCTCTPDFRGTHCQHPVARCYWPLSSDSSVFVFSNREGSIMSKFCPLRRVLLAVCNGVEWWPYGSLKCQPAPTVASLVISSILPGNTTSAKDESAPPEFSRSDSAGIIALVIASLVGLQLILPFICYCCIACCKFDENKLISEERHLSRERLTTFLRACSGFFYFSWWAWLVYLMYYLCVWHVYVALDGTTVWSAVAIMAIICVCLLYVVVLCESICSREYEYLTKMKDVVTAEELVARMKSESPSIKLKAECWHPETRTRTIHDGSGQDGNGMHTEMCTVHITTAAFEEMFSYSNSVDVSDNFLLPACNAALTQVYIDLAVEFADDESQRMFDETFALFKSSNRGRDEQVDFTVEYNLSSYVKELAVRDPDKRWMTSRYFILATCACFTWPYRWILNSSKNEYHYRIAKKVTVTPTYVAPAGHPTYIDISNAAEHPLLPLAPPIQLPITPPPPYEK